MDKIKEIEIKIKEIKNKNKKKLLISKKSNANLYSMAMNISIELITGIGIVSSLVRGIQGNKETSYPAFWVFPSCSSGRTLGFLILTTQGLFR